MANDLDLARSSLNDGFNSSDLYVVPLMCADVPFSIVADTFTLPITVPAQIDQAINDYYFPEAGEENPPHFPVESEAK